MRIGVYKRLIAGMANVEDEVSAERGPFSLFALIEKEDWNESDNYPLGSSWHLFVAAPWIWDEGYTAEKFLQERVRPYEEGWSTFESSLSIHVVKPTSAYLEEVWEYCSTENGIVEVYNVDILDVTARRGYIFASDARRILPTFCFTLIWKPNVKHNVGTNWRKRTGLGCRPSAKAKAVYEAKPYPTGGTHGRRGL